MVDVRWVILPDRRIYWIASPISRVWTICILIPWIQESFVRLDHSRCSGRAIQRQTQTMWTADISRVLATWAWWLLQITSDKNSSSRYRPECQSVRQGSIITIQKQIWRYLPLGSRDFYLTWGAAENLRQSVEASTAEKWIFILYIYGNHALVVGSWY